MVLQLRILAVAAVACSVAGFRKRHHARKATSDDEQDASSIKPSSPANSFAIKATSRRIYETMNESVGSLASVGTESVSGNEYPFVQGCSFRKPFTVQKACAYPDILKAVPACKGGASASELCIKDTSYDDGVKTRFSELIRTSETTTTFEFTAQLGFSLFGDGASADFNTVKQSHAGLNSISFWISGGGKGKTSHVQNYENMEISDEGLALLESSPTTFLQKYGFSFIHSIQYGGSFTGYFSITSNTSVHDNAALGEFLNLSSSGDGGVFGAAGSQDLMARLAANDQVEHFAEANWQGGCNMPKSNTFASPSDMKKAFDSFDASWRQCGEPMTVRTRRWIDLKQLMFPIMMMSPDVYEMFSFTILGTTLNAITEEEEGLSYIRTSIQSASEITSQSSILSCMQSVNNEVDKQQRVINDLDDYKTLLIQKGILDGDYSWFKYNNLVTRFDACVA